MGGQKLKKRSGSKINSGECKRRAITLKEKLEVIKRFECKERTCDIVRATGIKESTLRTIRDNAEKIKASFIAGISLSASKSVRMRSKYIEEMERILSDWIERQTKNNKSEIHFSVIKKKALSTYESIKNKSDDPSNVPPFSASTGWFAGFKIRHSFPNLSAGNEMRKIPQNPIGPRELLLPNIEAEAQEQLHFTSNNVENLDEMKEEIQEDQADSNMSLIAKENQSHEMTHGGTNSVTMDTYQPSSRKLLVVPEHQYSMMSSLASMWKDQTMCDASIGNGTTIIMVHKLVLLAISPTLLSSSEVRNNCFLRVNFPANISENAMRAFAEYMYNGMLDLDPLTLTQLQQISYQLGIDELGMLCEMHLCSQTHNSSSIDNIMCPGTSLSHLVQSDSSSLQMLERKHNSVPEVKKKRTMPTNTWLQCSGSQEIVSHSPVAVKTEPQNSVQDYCLTNPTEQALHPARSTTTAGPVSEATYCQRSNSTFSMTKASKTTKTFQEYNRTIESQFVSHIKMEPADNLESEYGQHHPTLSSHSSISNLPFTKINQSRDISESTKLTPGASPLISTFSNFHQKYARSKTNTTAAAHPLPVTPAGKVVPLTCDESARVNLTGKNHFDATVNSEQATSNTPYPVMLFSAEMKNLPLNISQTTKSKQYVDLTSS